MKHLKARIRPPRGMKVGSPLAFVALLPCLSFVGCEPGPDATRAAEGELSTITILFPGQDEHSLTPVRNLPPFALLYQPLIQTDSNGDLHPVLARSWEHSEDQLTWTYHLRSDVKWHDGEPFTAHDIAFTVGLLSHPDVLLLAPGSRTVSVVDDTTVTITYGSQRARIFGHGFTVYLPRHLLGHLDPADYGDWDFQSELWPPVGYGPFRFVRHEPKTMVELEANPDWFRGRPKVDRLIIRFGGNPVIEFEAGNVDASASLDLTTAFNLAARPEFDYCLTPSWFPSAIYWNHRHVALSDVRVRQALSLAIDRRELAAVRGFPDDVALPDVMLTPDQRSSFRVDTRSDDWSWPEDVPMPLSHDVARAARLLDEAGWRDEDGDGVREKGDLELRFNLLTDAGGVTDAVVLQEQFRRVGAQVEIQTIDRSVGRLRFQAGDFDAALTGIAPRAYGGPMFYALAGDPAGSPERPAGYFNPRLDSLVAAEEEWNGKPLEESWLEMQSILRDDVVVTFLLPELRVTVFRPRVRGLLENDCLLFYAEELWVEEEGAPRLETSSTGGADERRSKPRGNR